MWINHDNIDDFSSSVRRSSFRDKEKAARKLDTSFKDVLYAQDIRSDKEDETNLKSKKTTVVKIINNKLREEPSPGSVITNSKFDTENMPPPETIRTINNHRVENEKNKLSSAGSFGANKKSFYDDHNNNQLKVTMVEAFFSLHFLKDGVKFQ